MKRRDKQDFDNQTHTGASTPLYDTDGIYAPFEDMTGETGSYRYMAPEVFKHQPYGRPVDVYSFSLICYYMMSSDMPWPGIDGITAAYRATFEKSRPPIPHNWDERITKLITACWSADPALRPSFAAVLTELESIYLFSFGEPYSESNTVEAPQCCTIA